MSTDSPIAKHNGQFILTCTLIDFKHIYRALFAQLRADPEADLDESDFLMHVQIVLQREAQSAGVDISNHSDWERFLGEAQPISCEERYANHPCQDARQSRQGS